MRPRPNQSATPTATRKDKTMTHRMSTPSRMAGSASATLAIQIRQEFAQEAVDIPAGLAMGFAMIEIEDNGAAGPGIPMAPAGPDEAAPITHQAWEEVVDARLAVQHLESKAQEYAAGLFEPEDITPADRRDMGLYLIAARACLTQAERLFGLA